MTIQVELNPELEARLAAEARAHGVSLGKAAERLQQEILASRNGPDGNLTIQEFHAMLNDMAAGSENLPEIPTEAFMRDSFYRSND
jgi:hypothetical protein